MKRKGKEKVVVNKDEHSENWCFVCKDGGDLRICDYKNCLKSYHPGCVEMEDSFLDSKTHWDCAWHTCFRCRRPAKLHCYTCIHAVCSSCLPKAGFMHVKGKNGFCRFCLRLVLLIEEGRDYDSDGDKVDFTDRETVEGLYMEYYMIIKREEGFEDTDIYAARGRLKKKKHHSGFSSEEYEEEEKVQISDDNEDDESEYENMRWECGKEKRSAKKKSAVKITMKSNRMEFTGWASKLLIEFLDSIGKSTSKELSQNEVTYLVNGYVKDKNLFHPEKRRIIVCDAQLRRLFRRKKISKYRVHELLETHFAENEDVSEDGLEYCSEDNKPGCLNVNKRQRKIDTKKPPQQKELENNVMPSCFASIIVENMKLIYLKRSLLRELIKKPDSFEENVIGCLVRVKSGPSGNHSRDTHCLVQVKGVKTVSTSESNVETILLLSDVPNEVCISLLSDGDISEEECHELRQKMQAGHLKRLTVEELQHKAKILHKDITTHWINKELALLENLIDRANEKGWRRELFEYFERRKKLQNPIERLKLLENVPVVIPNADNDPTPRDEIYDRESKDDSHQSYGWGNSTFLGDEWQSKRMTGGRRDFVRNAKEMKVYTRGPRCLFRPSHDSTSTGEQQHSVQHATEMKEMRGPRHGNPSHPNRKQSPACRLQVVFKRIQRLMWSELDDEDDHNNTYVL